MCVYMYVCVRLHVSGGEKLEVAAFLKHFLPYSLRQGLSWNLVLANLAILAGQRISCLHLPRAGLAHTLWHSAFTQVLVT